MSSPTTAGRVHHLLSEGSVAERQAFVESLPPHPLRDTVRALMESPSLITPMAALAALAKKYCVAGDPRLGAELAAGLRARAKELAPTLSDSGALSIALSGLAIARRRALARCARIR